MPYNDMALAPGMVVAIEPGIYLPGVGGVRLENVVLVTADGCELLTRHLAVARAVSAASCDGLAEFDDEL